MRIAMDTGGTFTDCVFVRDGKLEVVKVFSTPGQPEQAIFNALQKAAPDGLSALDLICGTTVGTNALLERRGGRVALITTAGFEDVLEIGRQARPQLYNFFVQRAVPLVPADLRLGVAERVSGDVRALLRVGYVSLAIGLAVLAFCLLGGRLLAASFGDAPWSRFFAEGLVILGWVANWRPLEIFLYDWWPLIERRRLYSRLAAAPSTGE